MSYEWNVVAPPLSGSWPLLSSASFRYRCRVKYERSLRSGVSYVPSQCAANLSFRVITSAAILTFEILATNIFQEPHTFVQSCQLPGLVPPHRSAACNIWPIVQLVDFRHCTLDPCPELRYKISIIPDDASAFPRVFVHSLHATSNVDHCAFPRATSRRLGCSNELITFFL